MALSVDGQFHISFNLGGNTDFVKREDLIEFTVYEYAGNVMPTFELSFISGDDGILRKLNEGNTIEAQSGKVKEDVKGVTLFTSSLETTKAGTDRRIYKISGFAVKTDYIINHNLQITDEKSAIEIVVETALRNFEKVESNITKSDDKQNWIQHNISDRQFLNDVIMRADLGTSFPVTAITSDGTFIIHDLEKLIETDKPDWRLTKNRTSKDDIIYDTDVSIESQAGFINNWIGYGKELKVINTIDGEVESVFEDPKIIMSMSNELDKSKTIEKRYGGSRSISDNVSSTYWSAFNHNLQSLANLSKIDNTVSFTNIYKPVRPLDIVNFSEESNKNDAASSEHSSGKYIVSGVVRTYQNNMTSTTLILNREAFNKVKLA